MFTATLPITIDGVRLDTLAFNVSTISGRRGLPGARSADIDIPGIHGVLPSFADTFEAAEIILQMWVVGCDPDGAIPGGASEREMYEANLDMLLHLFGTKGRLLDVRQAMGDGSTRRCWGKVVASFSPDVNGSNPVGRFSVAIQIPGVFWADVDPTDFADVASIESPRTVEVTTLFGSTAPIEDAVYVVVGPAVNPRISVPYNGSWVQLNRSLTAGESWRVDSNKWFSEVGLAAMGFDGSAVTNEIANTIYAGSGARLLTLVPERLRPDTTPTTTDRKVFLILGGSGFGSATRILVRAKKKFL